MVAAKNTKKREALRQKEGAEYFSHGLNMDNTDDNEKECR
jgi:hypothetical protein